MRTELRVADATCSMCLDAVLEDLRGLDGVHDVTSWFSAGCIAIDHNHPDASRVIEVVRGGLRGVAMASAEIVMVPVEPLPSELHCGHAPGAAPPAIRGAP